MNPSVAPAESSFLLWSLGVLVYVLAAHVGLAAVRLGRRVEARRTQAALVVTAGLAWGTAVSIGFVLGLAGMALPFGIGFQASLGLALWLGGAGLAAIVAAVLVRAPGLATHIGAGLVLGAISVGIQGGWLAAAGLRPGLRWAPEVLAAAGAVMAIGLAIAVSAAYSEPATISHLRKRWRVGAAGLIGLAWLAGQEIMLAGLGLGAQVGSVYQHQLSAPLLALVGGALVPIALLVLALDLRYRQRQQRRQQRDIVTTLAPADAPKRRRKYRIRGL